VPLTENGQSVSFYACCPGYATSGLFYELSCKTRGALPTRLNMFIIMWCRHEQCLTERASPLA